MYHVVNILVSPTFSIICEAFVFIPRSGLSWNKGKSHKTIENLNDYNLIVNVYLKADRFWEEIVSSNKYQTLISNKN